MLRFIFFNPGNAALPGGIPAKLDMDKKSVLFFICCACILNIRVQNICRLSELDFMEPKPKAAKFHHWLGNLNAFQQAVNGMQKFPDIPEWAGLPVIGAVDFSRKSIAFP
jgi:hypothetical protein